MFSRVELILLGLVFWIWSKRTARVPGPANVLASQQQTVNPSLTTQTKPHRQSRSRSRELKNDKSRLGHVLSSGVLASDLPLEDVQSRVQASSTALPVVSSGSSHISPNHHLKSPVIAHDTIVTRCISGDVMNIDEPGKQAILQRGAKHTSSHGFQQVDASGAFANAHDFTLNNPIMIESTMDDFMKEFSAHTIPGAELDSSLRDPPPHCHPGTRVRIVDGMRSRLCNPTKRVQWLVGPAGVGKSAIMQTVAELEREASSLVAALFFSAPNGRNDPTKVISTLAYQIARQHQRYHQYIRSKVKADPNLWDRSIDTHFTEFVIEPFVTRQVYRDPRPVLIFVDGLDECKGRQEQLHILSLISNFTVKYPRAPLLWVIASRPEAHITAHLHSLSFYDKVEVSIDSTEACQDVERFARAEFERIRESDPLIKSLCGQWPPEHQLMQFLAAVLGFFAYAETAIRFIADLNAGDSISRFQVIMNLINNVPPPKSSVDLPQPMAQLDMLYRYLLSQVSPDNIPHVKEILAFVIFAKDVQSSLTQKSLSFMCDWLGTPPYVVYAALRHLHSVLYVPLPRDATLDDQRVRIYHKSFSDFLLDQGRSSISLGTLADERHRSILRAFRILRDIPYLQTPKHNAHTHIALSCSYKYDHEAELIQRSLYFNASWEIRHMPSLPGFPQSKIAHALKVSQFDIRNEYGVMSKHSLRLLFDDDRSEVSQLLRKDGALRDIPVSLLDWSFIRNEEPIIAATDEKSISDLSTYSCHSDRYSAYQQQLISHLKHAKACSSRELVRVFIGTELKGIVQFKAAIVPKGLPSWARIQYLIYDFSTIYEHLQKPDKRGLQLINLHRIF